MAPEPSDETSTQSDLQMPTPSTTPDQIRQGITISGPFIPEAMEVLAVIPFGSSLKVIGRGAKTARSYDLILSPEQIAQLKVTGESEPFDGSGLHFRMGVEAHRLGLAYEYDPYFSLSIARVDPLPHQLEAVYGYFLKLPLTEHKDSLDFLVGDGKDGRPHGKLREWGLTVTQIHGGMKIGDRDTPGTRIYSEREFREAAQVLVATEAAGEGINLQFCSQMINYDIPWNPVRLEQRVGRIHRYGQEHDCIIFNKKEPTLEWVTPGHPLFEAIREEALERVHDHLKRGAIFYDIQRKTPCLMDVFAASVKDGRGRTLHRRLFVVETDATGQMTLRLPTVFHDINPAPKDAKPVSAGILAQPDRVRVEQFLFAGALSPSLADRARQRAGQIEKVARHVEISLNALIDGLRFNTPNTRASVF